MAGMQKSVIEQPLYLRAGETVEVKPLEEIIKTLNENGETDGMLFMPEMAPYCGKTFRVSKRADKTCDTINKTGGRRLYNTVHLDDLRCDGSAHGGCEAACLFFWNEMWLKRIQGGAQWMPLGGMLFSGSVKSGSESGGRGCTEELLAESVYRNKHDNPDQCSYRCQITELLTATAPLKWWDLNQYIRDVLSRNVSISRLLRTSLISLFRNLSRSGIGYRVVVNVYNRLGWLHGGVKWPFRGGVCDKTPHETLDLQPGDMVEVKSHDEILQTLDPRNRNRGLYFDPEMVQFCGNRYRVLKRVGRILDERTGRMLRFPNDCLILEDVVCQADYSNSRLFCPRGIYPYWREIWLKRVDDQV